MSRRLFEKTDFNDREGRLFARLPKEVKRQLKLHAARQARDMNAELIVRLAHSLDHFETIEGISMCLEPV